MDEELTPKAQELVPKQQELVPKQQELVPKQQELTPKQQRFVEEYLVDLNGTQAAIRAGYSEKTARQIATENLARPHIQKVLQAAREEQSERTKITADMVIRELALIAFSDMADFAEITEAGAVKMKPLDTLPEYSSRAIQKLKEKRLIVADNDKQEITSDTIEYQYYDKLKALELLGKHLGMFSDRIKLQGDPDSPLGPIQIVFKKPDDRS